MSVGYIRVVRPPDACVHLQPCLHNLLVLAFCCSQVQHQQGGTSAGRFSSRAVQQKAVQHQDSAAAEQCSSRAVQSRAVQQLGSKAAGQCRAEQ